MRREDQLALLKSTPLDEQTINALIEAFGSPKITKDKVDEAWEKFLSYYPKRQGTNPKQEAYDMFRQNCAKGEDPDALVYAAKMYRKECEKPSFDGKPIIGTPGVMQMVRFLRPSKRVFADYLPQGEEHKWELVPKVAQPDIHYKYKEAWKQVCHRMCAEVGEATYRAWLDKLELAKFDNGVAVLKATSKFTADYVSQHFGNRLSEFWGGPVKVVS